MTLRNPFKSLSILLATSLMVGAFSASCVFAAEKPTYRHKMEIAQLLYFNGDVDRAINAFKMAGELDPKAYEPHLNLLNLYIQRGGDKALEQAQVEAQEVIKRKPNNREAHLILGHILRTQAGSITDPEQMKAKLLEARKEVETAEELKAPLAMSENTIGLIDLQLGDSDSALQHINNAIKKQFVFPDAHLVRAVLLFKGATKVEAHGRDTTVTIKDFNAPELKEKIADVMKELDIAIEQKKKNPEARNTKADILLAQGKHAEALSEYKKAAADEPKYVQAWAGIGNTEAQLAAKETESSKRDEHYRAARDAFEKAVKLKPGEKNNVYGLALMDERLGDTVSAISEFQNGMMVETDPVMRAQIALHVQQLQQTAILPGLSNLPKIGPGAVDTTLSTTNVEAKLLGPGVGIGTNSGGVSGPIFTGSSMNKSFASLIKIKPPAGKEKEAE